MRRQQHSQRFAFMRFDQDRSKALVDGDAFDLVEKHRLAHAAQTRQQQALLGALGQDPTKGLRISSMAARIYSNLYACIRQTPYTSI